MTKRYFPMFVDISDKKLVVVGGGTIGMRRIRTLLEFTDRLTVVDPKPNEELARLEKDGRIELVQDVYHREYIEDAWMVVSATDIREVNQKVKDDCLAIESETGRKILVNIADKRALNDFYFPGIVLSDDIVVGINSGGASPALVKKTRQEIEAYLKNV